MTTLALFLMAVLSHHYHVMPGEGRGLLRPRVYVPVRPPFCTRHYEYVSGNGSERLSSYRSRSGWILIEEVQPRRQAVLLSFQFTPLISRERRRRPEEPVWETTGSRAPEGQSGAAQIFQPGSQL